MPLTNWPPASYPVWPPAGIVGRLEFSDVKQLLYELRRLGYTQSAPNTTENNLYFKGVQCDEGHNVIGRMLISPEGVRYPFAVCVNNTHRQLLVLWGPEYCMGKDSGIE